MKISDIKASTAAIVYSGTAFLCYLLLRLKFTNYIYGDFAIFLLVCVAQYCFLKFVENDLATAAFIAVSTAAVSVYNIRYAITVFPFIAVLSLLKYCRRKDKTGKILYWMYFVLGFSAIILLICNFVSNVNHGNVIRFEYVSFAQWFYRFICLVSVCLYYVLFRQSFRVAGVRRKQRQKNKKNNREDDRFPTVFFCGMLFSFAQVFYSLFFLDLISCRFLCFFMLFFAVNLINEDEGMKKIFYKKLCNMQKNC